MDNTTLEDRYQQMLQRMALNEYRKNHDRVRVVITAVNDPDPDEPADSLYILVKATDRLRELKDHYCQEYDSAWDFEDASPNVLPQHGPQLQIGEWALQQVLRCPPDHYYDGESGSIEALIADFIHILSGGYHAQVIWARKRNIFGMVEGGTT